MQIIMDILALFSLISIIKLIMNIDKSRRSKIDSKKAPHNTFPANSRLESDEAVKESEGIILINGEPYNPNQPK